jgi:phenylalanyl-tRNA synthetase alpha chain
MSATIPELKQFDEADLDRVFAELEAEVSAQARALTSDEAMEAFRLEWLGRKQGRLGQLSAAWLKSAPVEAKKLLGVRFNKLKAQIEEARAATAATEATPAGAGLDVTLPGSAQRVGAEHPLVKTMAEIVSVFQRMGYSVVLGPEV